MFSPILSSGGYKKQILFIASQAYICLKSIFEGSRFSFVNRIIYFRGIAWSPSWLGRCIWSSSVSEDWIYISHTWCTVNVALCAEHTSSPESTPNCLVWCCIVRAYIYFVMLHALPFILFGNFFSPRCSRKVWGYQRGKQKP